MTKAPLLSAETRRLLKQRAHHLKPVVLLGAAGLSDPVLAEIDQALTHHELIKVRLNAEERDAQVQAIAAHTGAVPIQRIGHVASLYRARPVAVPTTPVTAPPPVRRPATGRAAGRPAGRAARRPDDAATERRSGRASAPGFGPDDDRATRSASSRVSPGRAGAARVPGRPARLGAGSGSGPGIGTVSGRRSGAPGRPVSGQGPARRAGPAAAPGRGPTGPTGGRGPGRPGGGSGARGATRNPTGGRGRRS